MTKDIETKNTTLEGEITCIKVTKETRQKLANRGKKGESYETVISNLLENGCNQVMGDVDETS